MTVCARCYIMLQEISTLENVAIIYLNAHQLNVQTKIRTDRINEKIRKNFNQTVRPLSKTVTHNNTMQ